VNSFGMTKTINEDWATMKNARKDRQASYDNISSSNNDLDCIENVRLIDAEKKTNSE
jgi:isocitrate dehydrogenase kinase/phosphatase